MTSIINIVKASIFLTCLLALSGFVHGQTITSDTETIELDLARFVASEQVHRNNQPFEWRAVDHMILHDVDGEVQAYAFIFAKSDNEIKTPEDLQRHIMEKSELLYQAQEKATLGTSNNQAEGEMPEPVVKAEENLYAFKDLATVITGAVSNSRLIQRHFRGIPEFWVRAETLDVPTTEQLYGQPLQISSVIMITPMDFRLAESDGSQPTNFRTIEKTILSPNAQSINVSTQNTETIESIKTQRLASEERKRQQFESLEPAERVRYEKALQERSEALAVQWNLKREMKSGLEEAQ